MRTVGYRPPIEEPKPKAKAKKGRKAKEAK